MARRLFAALFVFAFLAPAAAPIVEARAEVGAVELSPLLPLRPESVMQALPAPSATPVEAAARETKDWVSHERVVVGFEGEADVVVPQLAALARAMRGELVRVDATLSFAVLQLPAHAQERFLHAASALDGVRYAKPDMRVASLYVPDDTRYAEQWGPAAMNMHAAWNVTLGDHSRTVAVIDTGVWAEHPDLAANLCVVGPDYVNGDADAHDDHGHGTHVAGTVAAVVGNAMGVAGVANVCLMSIKTLDAGGSGWFSDTASGIVWAADNGAHVVSMSLGGCAGCDPGSPTSDAVAYAAAADVLVVAAAGNAWCSPVAYPAAYPEVVAVAALAQPGFERATFSSCGSEVELSAPGENIVSTSLTSGPLSDASGYMSLSGTSMATPHVSGLAALLWSANASMSATELRCVLAQTAHDISEPGRDAYTGFGRVDAAAALGSACTPTLPSRVALDAQARPERALLSWSAASAFGHAVTGYNVYRGASESNLTLLAAIGDVRSHEDAPLENGVTMHYAVAAVNALGEGPLSEVRAVTPQPPVPFECAQVNDTFGNACAPTTFDFVDIRATGASLPAWDDGVFEVELPFAFTHYGFEYASVGVSTNGFLQFGNNLHSGCCEGRAIPDADAIDNLVVAFWTDLNPAAGGSVKHETKGAEGARVFIVQFTNVPFFGGYDEQNTFQIKLFESDGAVEVHYEHVQAASRTVTAGIEDCRGTDGIEAARGPLSFVHSAVRYTPGSGAACIPPPPNTPPRVTIDTPVHGELVSGEMVVSGTVEDTDEGAVIVHLYAYVGPNFFALEPNASWSFTVDTLTLEDGWNLIEVYAYDGRDTGWDLRSVEVDNSGTNRPPRTTITTPSAYSTVTGNITTTGYAIDPEGDDVVQINVTHMGPGFSWTFVVSGASWGMNLGSDYPEGWHEIQAVASDGESWGAASIAPFYYSTRQANTPPVVNITTPLDGATVTTLRMQGTAYDPDGGAVDHVRVTLSGENVSIIALANGTSSWSHDWGADWPAGTYTLSASAWDGEGWGEASPVIVRFDPAGGDRLPVTRISSPEAGSNVHGNIVTTGIAYDPDGEAVDTVRLDLRGPHSWTTTWVAPGNWSFDWGAFPQSGNYSIAAQACGAAGCGNADLVSFTYAAAPAVTAWIDTPTDGEVVSGLVTVSGGALHPVANRSIDLVVVSDPMTGVWWHATGTTDWSAVVDTSAILNGERVLEVHARDDADVWHWSLAQVTIVVDNPNQPPTTRILSHVEGARLSGSVHVFGTASDRDSNIEQVEVCILGVSIGTCTGAFGTSWWSANFDTTFLPDGDYTLSANAFDGEAWGEPHAIGVRVVNEAANAPPTVMVTNPLAGETVSGHVQVRGTASDSDGAVALVQVSVDGGAWRDAGGASDWVVVWDTTQVENGAHTLAARAYDGEAYSAIAQVEVHVRNNRAPNVTIVEPAAQSIVSGVVAVSGRAWDHDDDALSVEIRVNGGDWRIAEGGSVWTRLVDTRTYGDGLLDIETRAFDGAAHSPVALRQVHVRNDRAPEIVIETPANGTTLRGSVNVTGSALDPDGDDVLWVQVRLGNGPWLLAEGTRAWSKTLDTASLPNGVHELQVRAWDGFAYRYALARYDVANAADLKLDSDDIKIVREGVQTDAGTIGKPVAEKRTVLVTVHNLGTLPSKETTLRVDLEGNSLFGTTSWYLAEVAIPAIEAGASRTFALSWDTRGWLGDVTLRAEVDPYALVSELDETNNVATAATYVGAGGVGFGTRVP